MLSGIQRYFLTEAEWKTVRDFEGALRETSRLTTICQNEDKLNGVRGPGMRKALHDIFSRVTVTLTDAEEWSAHKEIVHPTRSEPNVDSFAEKVKVYRTRELLKCERRFFNNKTEETFAERNTEFYMKLTDREKTVLVLEKKICWSKSAFDGVAKWKCCESELKIHCTNYFSQTKSCERNNE